MKNILFGIIMKRPVRSAFRAYAIDHVLKGIPYCRHAKRFILTFIALEITTEPDFRSVILEYVPPLSSRC